MTDNYVNLPLSNYCNIDSEQLVEENDHEIVRSLREKNPPSHLCEWVYLSNNLQKPKTVEEANSSPKSECWKKDM